MRRDVCVAPCSASYQLQNSFCSVMLPISSHFIFFLFHFQQFELPLAVKVFFRMYVFMCVSIFCNDLCESLEKITILGKIDTHKQDIDLNTIFSHKKRKTHLLVGTLIFSLSKRFSCRLNDVRTWIFIAMQIFQRFFSPTMWNFSLLIFVLLFFCKQQHTDIRLRYS